MRNRKLCRIRLATIIDYDQFRSEKNLVRSIFEHDSIKINKMINQIIKMREASCDKYDQ
jgi:hypothetical protein